MSQSQKHRICSNFFRRIYEKCKRYAHDVQCVVKKIEETGQWSGEQKLKCLTKKISIVDEQYLKVISLRNRNKSSKDFTQDLGDVSDPSVVPIAVH